MFAAPLELTRRLGRSLDAVDLARTDPDDLTAIFPVQSALHRFPAAMAQWTQKLCQIIAGQADRRRFPGLAGGHHSVR
nr:hypothetical protein [Frankia tisae]